MITYTPTTPLEAAVLESGRFELTTDTAGREVLVVGHQRMPKIVMLEKAEGLHDLIQAVAATGARSFSATAGDPWEIDEEESDERDTDKAPTAAEEYLVMGMRALRSDGRPVRVAAGRGVVRLFVLPWILPAKTVGFGMHRHFVVTSARGVVGDWEPVSGGRSGVVVGVPEMWVGIFERYRRPGSELVYRCDVPVPWVGESGLSNSAPTTVGVYDRPVEADAAGLEDPSGGETWVAKIPVVMTEGDVVQPVAIPADVDVDEVPEGAWELEAQSSADFSIGSLT